MSLASYLWRWCCWESLHPWKRGWSPAVGGAGGCDQESSRTALMPGSWPLTQSSSPSPSPHASDSTSCDCRGSGTWGGRWERILLGKPTGGRRRGGGTRGCVSRQMVTQVCTVGANQIRCTRFHDWRKSVSGTHLNMSCSITSSQYKPMRVRKSAKDTMPN